MSNFTTPDKNSMVKVFGQPSSENKVNRVGPNSVPRAQTSMVATELNMGFFNQKRLSGVPDTHSASMKQ